MASRILGFESEEKAAKSLLEMTISNRLSRAISWEGTSGFKIAFEATRLNEAIHCKY